MIKLRLLGALDLRGPEDKEILSVLSQPKRTSLLAYLAVARPREFHTRDKLLGLFWPEHDQKRARASLRQALYTLRQSVGDDILRSRGAEEIDLARERIWCDVVAFEEAVGQGQMEAALTLYRGDLLDGVFLSDCPEFERWLDGERERLRELASEAAWNLAHQQLRTGHLVEAERTGQKALGLVGTDESAVRAFVRDLAEAGDRGAAVNFYEKFAYGLERDLDLRPAAESRELADRIRASMEIPVTEDQPDSAPSSMSGAEAPGSSPYPPAPGQALANDELAESGRAARLEGLRAALAHRYSIEKEIGSGGMGTVYRATDLKHHRKVAIKVLKSEVTAGVEADRFLREIETAASLNHPHILPVHDSGRADAALYYVTPFVPDESLRTRMERERQLPVEEAVRIASAVASALDYAHREGVIHRDIKPANILLQDGEPMLADFGIAVGASCAPGGRLTGPSVIMGSPEYMSPEQAIVGQAVGPAADVYALGCVLYEMLAGEPPFTGATAQAALAKIRTEAPRSMSGFRSMIPPNVDAAIRRALEKAPADRFTSARKFAEALGDPGFRHRGSEAPPSGRWKQIAMAGWGVAATLAVLVLWSALSRAPSEVPVRRSLAMFSGPTFAISPDGSMIVYGEGEGGGGLWRWVREEDQAIPIQGTVDAEDPSFSPDGRYIVFGARGFIKTVPVLGGEVTTVVPAPIPPLGEETNIMDIPTHPAWGEDGMVYWAQGRFIYRRPADGSGEIEQVTTEKGWLPGFPNPLPEGRGFLLTTRHWEHATDRHHDSIAVVGPEGGEPKGLVEGVFARYAWSGHLLFTTGEGTLMGAPFDLEALKVSGPPVTLIEAEPGRAAVEIQYSGKGAFDISQTGTLAYRTGGVAGQLVMVCRSGTEGLTPVDSTWIAHLTDLVISPDGSRFAVMETRETTQVIWVSGMDGVRDSIWSSPEPIRGLGWTPDGGSVAYIKDPDPWDALGKGSPFIKRVDSDESERRLLPRGTETTSELIVWHPEGDWFVYSAGPGNGQDPAGIWASRTNANDPPVLLVESRPDHQILQPQAFSPDGRYLAYLAEEVPQESVDVIHEVWVLAFDNPGGENAEKIPTGPAGRVRWSRDGGTIFFDGPNNTTRGISVETDPRFSWSGIDIAYYHGRGTGYVEELPEKQTFLVLTQEWLENAAGEKRYPIIENYFIELRERTRR